MGYKSMILRNKEGIAARRFRDWRADQENPTKQKAFRLQIFGKEEHPQTRQIN